jgi:hypothetical protein
MRANRKGFAGRDRPCREVLLLATAMIDGEATTREIAAVDAHLASCADCRAAVDSHTRLAMSVRVHSAAGIGPASAPSRQAPRRSRRVVAGVAALAVAAALAGAMLRPEPPPHSAPPARQGPLIAQIKGVDLGVRAVPA